jgi:hypothetical protein
MAKEELAREQYSGKCFMCHKPYGKGFAFHHKEYDPTRKTHRDFKNTLDYNRYVIPEIISCPNRFRLLCKNCHAKIDQPRFGYLGHMKKDKLIRTFMVAFETIPKKRPRKGKHGGESQPSVTPALNSLETEKGLDACVLDELNNLKSFLMGYTER